MYKKLFFSSFIVVGLMACNGGGSSSGSSSATATGQFKDANVAGLSYVSGNQSGVTDSNGRFTYEIGQPVMFSVGGVTLGSVLGDDIITPIDLVANGSMSNPQVENIVRFLQTLDTDANPNNGIDISESTRTIAKTWDQVDFSTGNLDADMINIVSEVSSVTGNPRSLVTSEEAKAHMEKTMRCVYSGVFKGTYSGTGDNGIFSFSVSPINGEVSGIYVSSRYGQVGLLDAHTPDSYGTKDVAFISGNTDSGAEFSGKLAGFDAISGTWSNSQLGMQGPFSGNRLGGDKEAKYRFSASYTSYRIESSIAVIDDLGIVALNVAENNQATGLAYDLLNNQTVSVTGTVTDSNISLTAANGTQITGSVNLSDSDAANELYSFKGSYATSGGIKGEFSGERCTLN